MDMTSKLDDWKPALKKDSLTQSQWRKTQIADNYHQQPGLDEIRKIQRHIESDQNHHDIMKAFGIDAKTLLAIKDNRYSPVEGIKLDNLSKIYKGFESLEKRFDCLYLALNLLADNVFAGKNDQLRLKFKSLIKQTKQKSLCVFEEDKDEIENES
jgi:hypothetical protein